MDDWVYCLMGPTASGKTDLACQLVDDFPFEIISVDSAMIYREMDIGTAKPDLKTQASYPHHLIDVIDPTESYSVASFCDEARDLIQSIQAKGKVPLLVGGTMMYFKALQEGISNLPSTSLSLRESLLAEAQHKGLPAMHQQLQKVDPAAAKTIHPNDSQRILRALEVFMQTGKPITEYYQSEKKNHGFQFKNLRLMPASRGWLHDRIAKRFHLMLSQGFIDEVRELTHKWGLNSDTPSMRTVGYRQAFAHLQNEIDYNTFIEKGIASTRQLAKRQLTWLRNWPNGAVFDPEEPGLAQRVRKQIDP